MQSIPTIHNPSRWRRILRQIKALFYPLHFAEERERKYGDFYQITFTNSPPTIITSNPLAVKDLFAAPSDKFDVGIGNKGLRFLVGDNSILLLDGAQHKYRRHLLIPSFHGESLSKFSQQIVNITNQVIDTWQINQSFKVRSVMQEITLRVILTAVFGIDTGARAERLRRLLTKLLETFNQPLNSSLIFFPILQKDWGKFSPWGRFLALQREIRDLIYEEIRDRRKLVAAGELKSQDIFSLLLLAKDREGEGMTDEELHDELITLLFAGHETTASALSWLFYWIHYLPEVKDKLDSELNSLGANADYQEINNLSYLDAAIAETLRIYPIAGGTFARVLKQPGSIMGHDFDSKTWFLVSIYCLHHREDLYPNSKQFIPERFLQRDYSNYEYIPFGGGNRRCIGSALALLEMKLVTATILSRFQLDLVSKKPMFPVRRGLTMAPPASFKMRIKQKT